MLLGSFTSPRRLVVLACALFVFALLFLKNSGSGSTYLPKYGFAKNGQDVPSSPPAPNDHISPSPNEEELKAPPPPVPQETKEEEVVPTSSVEANPVWKTQVDDYAWKTGAEFALPSETAAIADDFAWKTEAFPTSDLPAAGTATVSSEESTSSSSRAPKPTYAWQKYEWDHDFYLKNGVKKLHQEEVVDPAPYTPYPDYDSTEWKRDFRGSYAPCTGARGKVIRANEEDTVRAWPRLPTGFPRAAVGDANVTGIDHEHCFDRLHRLGPYGSGQAEIQPFDDWHRPVHRPDWTHVNWGKLQHECINANKERYAPSARRAIEEVPSDKVPNNDQDMPAEDPETGPSPHYRHRTAIVIRGWEEYHYTENDLQSIRAIITETSLLTGGEYQIFLLAHVNTSHPDIMNNQTAYQETLHHSVPHELRSITVLWNSTMFEKWYPDIGHWDVAWHRYMPLQWFSKTHPQFDYVWNWEVDARYTGHHYQFFEAVSSFAKKRARKYLWERNQRVYIPLYHGPWEDFQAGTNLAIEAAISEGTLNATWGPQPFEGADQRPIGPTPPSSMEQDQFQWGVGEEADLITMQPIWDPRQTKWTNRDTIWNYIKDVRPTTGDDSTLITVVHHPENNNIPRRAFADTVVRFSAKMLHAMHIENKAGRAMQTNMWPATVALEHGLKAVYVPHPIWIDRKWPIEDLNAVFNADGGQPAQWSQREDSAYAWDRENNFSGWSSYPTTSSFAETLYRRWLGWPAWDESPLTGVGGAVFEEDGGSWVDMERDTRKSGNISYTNIGGNGRMCLPAMLLHPLKRMEVDAQSAPPEDEKTPDEEKPEEAPKVDEPTPEQLKEQIEESGARPEQPKVDNSPPGDSTTGKSKEELEGSGTRPENLLEESNASDSPPEQSKEQVDGQDYRPESESFSNPVSTPEHTEPTEVVAPPKEFVQPPLEEPANDGQLRPGETPIPQTELEKQKQNLEFWKGGDQSNWDSQFNPNDQGAVGSEQDAQSVPQTDLEKNRQNLDAPGG
ncbi:Hypothetical protein R9X50_00678900 [Acrodontium crateriforme]|uniref:Uncharacterized protein n=1 Tax=Acrodontium crateriforme TaxID=150365 RepID=A0AAQ3R722_9PEZI|nr:Hypothetical protein R9X50_00678900 [Acrodontium crateriforme]